MRVPIRHRPGGVSILVLMEVKREHESHHPGDSPREVSILVLMEVKRESALPAEQIDQAGFNPCFDGSEARGTPILATRGGFRSFNPCFDGSEARACDQLMISPPPTGFNPCFDGSEARGNPDTSALFASSRFQSLF